MNSKYFLEINISLIYYFNILFLLDQYSHLKINQTSDFLLYFFLGFILFQKSETSEWEEVQFSEDRNSYIFHGLQCGMRYQFYIVAFNGAGRGQPSSVIPAQTEGTGNRI